MVRLMMRAAFLFLLALPVSSNAQDQGGVAAKVTRAQFASLTWLIGAWRGSGAHSPVFYEDYRWLNDSTIRQRGLSDSTFRKANDSTDIALRNGSIVMLGGTTVKSVVVRITRDSLQFARPGRTTGGFTFVHESPTQWQAILAPPPGQTEATIYVMKRVRP